MKTVYRIYEDSFYSSIEVVEVDDDYPVDNEHRVFDKMSTAKVELLKSLMSSRDEYRDAIKRVKAQK